MAHTYFLVSTQHAVGLTSASLGLVRAFDRRGHAVGFCKPIAQLRGGDGAPEPSTALVRSTTHLHPPEPLPIDAAMERLAKGEDQLLLEEVVATVNGVRAPGGVVQEDLVTVVEGLVPTDDAPFADRLNRLIARALDAEVILVGVPEDDQPAATARHFAVTARSYGDIEIVGCWLNKVPQPTSDDEERPSGTFAQTPAGLTFRTPILERRVQRYRHALESEHLRLLGAVPYQPELAALRVVDVADALGARFVRRGDVSRRVLHVTVAAMTVPAVLHALEEGSLIIVPGDRNDVIMAAALTTLAGVPLAGILLTGGLVPTHEVLQLCSRATEAGLSFLSVPHNTLPTALAVMNLDREVPLDDSHRAELSMNTFANSIDPAFFERADSPGRARRLSPPAFRHQLIERARAANKLIVLPEGEEPRTVAAAIACQTRGIARCRLIGDAWRIARVAADQGLRLPDSLEIVASYSGDPSYAEDLAERRKHKGVTVARATQLLEDDLVYGTMMLARGEVDGLVAGAVHTTADTLRPALTLIKTAPGTKLVSSVFFMCLPEQVLVYGDCAVNPDPDAEMLADIALQSAASAQAFGIEPRVALISYSTGDSGTGHDVEKVVRATQLARAARPDLLLDGPLQYDAAVMPEVAQAKAPSSPVAGRATVLVFPDLNTGNTTYKAVQRSAQVVSMGPMLQGLARPVNDLSRGCQVEDIVYTIALTAIQATQVP